MKKIGYKWSLIMCLLVLLLCFLGFMFAPNDPDKIDLTNRLAGCSSQFPFGTDIQGRCLLSRILYGARTSVGIVAISFMLIIITACPVGLFFGLKQKFLPWFWDTVLNTITALPPIVYLMVFIGAWGNSVNTTFLALTLGVFPRLVKLVKTKTEIEMEKAYVLSAKVSGCRTFRLLFRHIFPNCLKEIISYMSLMCAEMIMMITSFSFIGLGLGDNVKELGAIIEDAHKVILLRNDIMLYPIIIVIIIALSFNLVGQEVE